MTQDREASLNALNEAHVFPGPFMFKVIGENSPVFVAQVVQAAVGVLGPQERPEVTIRESSGGRHQAVTMVVTVPDAERVLEIWAILGGLPGVKMVL
jgi:putative lipoic acid-binding regulatory protein